jgi:hypothetical protein
MKIVCQVFQLKEINIQYLYDLNKDAKNPFLFSYIIFKISGISSNI